jgi:hypothetical protein
MSYTIDRLDGDRIFIVSQSDDFDIAAESAALLREQLAILDASSGGIVFVLDLRNMSTKLDDIILAANSMRTEDGKAMAAHPHRLASAIITDSKILQLAVKGLNSATFGHLVAPVFGTLEDGLAYARQQLAAANPSA